MDIRNARGKSDSKPTYPKRVSLYETEEGLALLKTLARRRGVSGSDLLRMLIREEAERVGIATPAAGVERERERKPIWERIAERGRRIPAEARASLPHDLAEQHDHYLYGAPKR